MELKIIAYARNGHTDKFGIPRQSRDESPILTRIVFEPKYRVREAFRGIEGYSHLWLLWGFSARQADSTRVGHKCDISPITFSPTVRPPRLGGNKRMGVFATRSPFRPNGIGLSSVRLVRIDENKTTHAFELIVSGADVLDGTPIYDIKPYLSFSDSHPDACNGFAQTTEDYKKHVVFEESVNSKGEMKRNTNLCPPEEILRDIEYILSQDPRPGYHDDDREYKIDYAGWRVNFSVKKDIIIVKKIEKI